MDNWTLREDLEEISWHLDRLFPGSPLAARTRALSKRVESLRAEILAEWTALGPLWSDLGWHVENNEDDDHIRTEMAGDVAQVQPSGTGGP
jgi:hypothetical protein